MHGMRENSIVATVRSVPRSRGCYPAALCAGLPKALDLLLEADGEDVAERGFIIIVPVDAAERVLDEKIWMG